MRKRFASFMQPRSPQTSSTATKATSTGLRIVMGDLVVSESQHSLIPTSYFCLGQGCLVPIADEEYIDGLSLLDSLLPNDEVLPPS